MDKKQNEIGEYLIDVFRHAKEIGSLQTVEPYDYDAFSEYMDCCEVVGQMDLFSAEWSMHTVPMMRKLVNQAKILSRKYYVVCTNPPYMGKFEGYLRDFVIDKYKPYSGDLFSVFIFRNFDFCKVNGYSAFMTPFVWMFIKTYENLRQYIIDNKHLTTLVQMEYSAYEEATVPICSFVLQNKRVANSSLCFRLSDFRGGMEVQRIKVLEAIANPDCGYFYESKQNNFKKIEGSPIAYWASNNVLNAFEKSPSLGSIAIPKQGMATTDNGYFLRQWYEICIKDIGFGMSAEQAKNSGLKWFPINKGGEFRKWYGNNCYVVNYQYDGKELIETVRKKYERISDPEFVIKNRKFYFEENGTWSAITSGDMSVRYSPKGFIISNAGMAIYNKEHLKYIIAFLNSNCSTKILIKTINQSINFNAGDLEKLPLIIDELNYDNIIKNTDELIKISQGEWDSFETSWNFKKHPLLCYAYNNSISAVPLNHTVATAFDAWAKDCDTRFNKLKENEQELNRIFIDIYGLQDDLTPDVEDKDVTVCKADLQRDIKSLLSYAVGCMFGRYSLDADGLAYAGGEWDDSKYSTFIPDKDNCIPITDEEYFEDDIIGLFCVWLKKVYGADTLEENLDFIANALGNKGKTSREVIRNYFLNDFIKDHIKIYRKRPIYWLFDSGKQNGFKALVYMHRWNADTVGNLRVEYLHKMQHTYEREIARMQETIDNSRDSREVSKATKRKDKLQKQLKETKDYDAKLAHIALSRIEIDLDDGVKVNYEKVQTGRDGKKMQILAKI